MKKRQIGIRLTDAQIAHFEALAEKEGCESIAEMFRKAAFSRWPMNKSANCAPTVACRRQIWRWKNCVRESRAVVFSQRQDSLS